MRRFSFSNIAWPTTHDDEVSTLLRPFMSFIDIAPSKYFPCLDSFSDSDALSISYQWKLRGFQISAMQSLLYSYPSLNIFNSSEHRSRLLHLFDRLAYLASLLGSQYLIFGSARNRSPLEYMDNNLITLISLDFFTALGDICRKYDVYFCLEAMPSTYNGTFLTNHVDLFSFIKLLNHEYICANLDTGIASILGEDISDLLESNSGIIKHVHISEPLLKPLNLQVQDHASQGTVLRNLLPDLPLSVEMKYTNNYDYKSDLTSSCSLLLNNYA